MPTRLRRLVLRSALCVVLVPVTLAMWSEAGRLVSSSSDTAVAIGAVLFVLALVIAGGAVWLPAGEVLRLWEIRAARKAALREPSRADSSPRDGDWK
jgi:hypothetical protein